MDVEDEKFLNYDTEFATYIVNNKFSKVMRKSFNILAMDPSKDNKDAAIYWRDMAMLYMGVEAEETGIWTLSDDVEKKRWIK